eukprot:TRINITY_DN18684_c1_g1_i1.p1 TRINITY_DN18684_c1_g1~~TRINITY_DN18684_c1_g1_i1.p1  ORF type:complete len:155 (+),score=19.38 TRINITY_DN18684_c1_g1_i1:60-524(+)
MDVDLPAQMTSRPTATTRTGRRYALRKANDSSIWRLCGALENKRDVLPESLDSWTLELLRYLDERSAANMDDPGQRSSHEIMGQQSGQLELLRQPSESKICELPRRNERPRCAVKVPPDMASLQLLRIQFGEPDQQLLEFMRPLGSVLGPQDHY